MTNNGRSAGLHAPSGPAEQEVRKNEVNEVGRVGEVGRWKDSK